MKITIKDIAIILLALGLLITLDFIQSKPNIKGNNQYYQDSTIKSLKQANFIKSDSILLFKKMADSLNSRVSYLKKQDKSLIKSYEKVKTINNNATDSTIIRYFSDRFNSFHAGADTTGY